MGLNAVFGVMAVKDSLGVNPVMCVMAHWGVVADFGVIVFTYHWDETDGLMDKQGSTYMLVVVWSW